MNPPLYAAIEAGGTKMVLGIGSAEGSIRQKIVPTRGPDETLGDIAAFFADAPHVAGIGVASFGPLDLDPASPEYGHILPSAKQAWAGVDLLGAARKMVGGVPGAIDTDVNGAALAEARAAGCRDLAYVTVGTGIGVGLIVNGAAVHGAAHPEGGHLLLRRHPAHDGFAGICPFHHDCVEGLASGTAIRAAWGASLGELPADHVAWEVEAHYLAQLCAAIVLMTAPERIVLGGGVMGQTRMFAPVRDHAASLLAGYGRGTDRARFDSRIVPPVCREPSGLVGAYLLAAGAAAA
jgi:fructokinase